MKKNAYLLASATWAMACATNALAADPAPFGFNWGDRLEARVTAVQSKSVGAQKTQVEATYSFCAVRTPKGYEVGFANLAVSVGGQRAPDSAEVNTPMVLAGLVPYYTVTSQGEFAGLRDFDKLQTTVREIYRRQFKGAANPERFESVLAQTTSRAVLESGTSRAWLALVNSWNGVRIAPGAVVTGRSDPVAMPILEAPVTYTIEMSYPKREKCTSTATAANCARLRSVSVPDAESLRAAMDQVRQRFMEANATAPANVGLRDELEVVTEPATLRPHWVSWSRVIDVTTVEKGQEVAHHQDDTTTMTFEYGPQPACRPSKPAAK
jgi:hypothetical protein